MSRRVRACGTSAADQATSILTDANRRIHDAEELAPECGTGGDAALQVGQPDLWASGLGGGRSHVVMDPEVAEALREGKDWAETLVAHLRYANDHSGEIKDERSRRYRLRRTINALNAAFALHPDLATMDVRDDLAVLGLALDALDVGSIHPLLQTPSGSGNRPPDSRLSQQLRAYVVAFVVILEQAGISRPVAFKWVADELTRAQAPPPKGAKDRSTWNEETIKGWFYAASPSKSRSGHAFVSSEKRVSKRRDGDDHAVAMLIISFVNNAIIEKEAMPPSVSYAEEVIRATIRQPTFKNLCL